MAETYRVHFTLLRDATFGRGDGLAGALDEEVEHDANGLPYLRGRTLKGLLREEAADILFALAQIPVDDVARWQRAFTGLFGGPGSGGAEAAHVTYGDATLPDDLRTAVNAELTRGRRRPELQPADFLDALTAVRRQTAVDVDGAPDTATLRAVRVVLRGTLFAASLRCEPNLSDDEVALLAAVISTWQRAGAGRNRGRGRLSATLHQDGAEPSDITAARLADFVREAGL